jgi:hypothetical protein
MVDLLGNTEYIQHGRASSVGGEESCKNTVAGIGEAQKRE